MNLTIDLHPISKSVLSEYQWEFLPITFSLALLYCLALSYLPYKYSEKIYFGLSYIWIIIITGGFMLYEHT